MSLLGINGYGTYQFSSLTSSSSDSASTSDSTSAKDSSTSSRLSYYSSQNSSDTPTTSASTLARLKAILESVPKDANGRVTYSTIEDYKDSLESKFRSTVTTGLLALGVSEDAEFSLKTDPTTGEMTVYTQDEDKATIKAYFDANPDLESQFEKVQALNAVLEQAETKVSSAQLRKDIQLEFSSYWTSNASDITSSMSSSIYQYSSGNFSNLTGLNTFV